MNESVNGSTKAKVIPKTTVKKPKNLSLVASTGPNVKHVKPGDSVDDIIYNTPIGVMTDHYGNAWVCDTGNNRVVIIDEKLEKVLYVLGANEGDKNGSEMANFSMPFDVCKHPKKDYMYISYVGSGAVVILKYGPKNGKHYAKVHKSFPQDANRKNLYTPNGLAIGAVKNSSKHKHILYVADEFYHTDKTLMGPSRVCCFSDEGEFIRSFTEVTQKGGPNEESTTYPLLWPQGLSTDEEGRLYIANTGHYEILRCDEKGQAKAFKESHSPLLHSFGVPEGLDMFNIMRNVAIGNNEIIVGDRISNSLTLYDLNGKELAMITSILPSADALKREYGKFSPLELYIENTMLMAPYKIVPSNEPSSYLISLPYLSRIMKVRIKNREQSSPELEMLQSVGAAKRDQDQLDFNTRAIPWNDRKGKLEVDESNHLIPNQKATDLSAVPATNILKTYHKLIEKITDSFNYIVAKPIRSKLEKPLEEGPGMLLFNSGGLGLIHKDKKDPSKEKHHFTLMDGDMDMATHKFDKSVFWQKSPNTQLILMTNASSGMRIYQYDREKDKFMFYNPPGSKFGVNLFSFFKNWKNLIDRDPSAYIHIGKSEAAQKFSNIVKEGMKDFNRLQKNNVEYMESIAENMHSFLFKRDFISAPLRMMMETSNFMSNYFSATEKIHGFQAQMLRSVSDLKASPTLTHRIIDSIMEFAGVFAPNNFGNTGITVSKKGAIYIANPIYNRIAKWQFEPNGYLTFVKILRPKKEALEVVTKNGREFRDFTPTDIATDDLEYVYCTHQTANKIFVFNSKGRQVYSFGNEGYCFIKFDGKIEPKLANNFIFPTSLAVKNDYLVVNDLVNRAIKVFKIMRDEKGKPIDIVYKEGIICFGEQAKDAALWMPFYLSVDDEHIYVADCTLNAVRTFYYDFNN